MKKILIIEDDLNIGHVLEEALTNAGYGIFRAYSGTEAVLVLPQAKPDLVLLDLMLPGLHGEEVLPLMKGIPVIVLSAKADIDHKVNLLLDGAVDYVTKPFNMKELLARIAVQIRLSAVFGTTPILTFADIILNTDMHTVTIGESNVKLTRTELAILKLLMLNHSQVITKSLLLERISQDTPDCTESSLKIHISNLRKKLREVNDKEYIESVWGIGYKLLEE